MKNLAIIVLILIPLFWGCSDNNLISPEPKKGMQKTWIQLPQPENDLSTEMEFSSLKEIDGNKGGEIRIDKKYPTPGGVNKEVKISAVLKFQSGSFSGKRDITMVIDDINGTVTYSPSMNFDKPAILDLIFEGIDLTGVNKDQVDFVYIGEDGLFYPVSYKEIKVDLLRGRLELVDGLIPHFSRYGWGR